MTAERRALAFLLRQERDRLKRETRQLARQICGEGDYRIYDVDRLQERIQLCEALRTEIEKAGS